MKTQTACSNAEETGAIIQFKQVLVPIDFSECSKQALKYALDFAGQFGSQITLLAVVPNDLTAYEYGEAEAIAGQDRRVILWRKKLAHLAEENLPDTHYQIMVKTGKPCEEIVHAAKSLGVDMVIICTRGSSANRETEMGSTAEKVIRHAECPVLMIRPPEVR